MRLEKSERPKRPLRADTPDMNMMVGCVMDLANVSLEAQPLT